LETELLKRFSTLREISKSFNQAGADFCQMFCQQF